MIAPTQLRYAYRYLEDFLFLLTAAGEPVQSIEISRYENPAFDVLPFRIQTLGTERNHSAILFCEEFHSSAGLAFSGSTEEVHARLQRLFRRHALESLIVTENIVIALYTGAQAVLARTRARPVRVNLGKSSLLGIAETVGRMLRNGESKMIAAGEDYLARISSHDRLALNELARNLPPDEYTALTALLDQRPFRSVDKAIVRRVDNIAALFIEKGEHQPTFLSLVSVDPPRGRKRPRPEP